MPKPRTKPEDIKNLEHYFNRYISLEIKHDQAAQREIENNEVSLEERMERNSSFQLQVAVNTSDDMLLRIVISKEPNGWIDALENEELSAALHKLTPRQKEVIRLNIFEGMKLSEIAHQTGVSKSAIGQRYETAIKFLKKIFGTP